MDTCDYGLHLGTCVWVNEVLRLWHLPTSTPHLLVTFLQEMDEAAGYDGRDHLLWDGAWRSQNQADVNAHQFCLGWQLTLGIVVSLSFSFLICAMRLMVGTTGLLWRRVSVFSWLSSSPFPFPVPFHSYSPLGFCLNPASERPSLNPRLLRFHGHALLFFHNPCCK